jgi:hypothetical protein
MIDCTERHTLALADDLNGEGQESMTKVAQP